MEDECICTKNGAIPDEGILNRYSLCNKMGVSVAAWTQWRNFTNSILSRGVGEDLLEAIFHPKIDLGSSVAVLLGTKPAIVTLIIDASSFSGFAHQILAGNGTRYLG